MCAIGIFLDTELNAADYRRIAEVVRASGLSATEAEAILGQQVAPAFGANLRRVAGEWAGWPEDFVREQVLTKRGSLSARLINRLTIKRHLEAEWARIAAHLGS